MSSSFVFIASVEGAGETALRHEGNQRGTWGGMPYRISLARPREAEKRGRGIPFVIPLTHIVIAIKMDRIELEGTYAQFTSSDGVPRPSANRVVPVLLITALWSCGGRDRRDI